jgi:hypothetical protein
MYNVVVDIIIIIIIIIIRDGSGTYSVDDGKTRTMFARGLAGVVVFFAA